MKLQQATDNDLAKVVSWIDSEKSCRMWGGPLVSYPICLDVLVSEIEFRETNSYVSLIENELVGFGQIFERSQGTNHLARIIVNPESRGKGYGFEFLKYLISVASKGADSITLNVYRSNDAALNVYKKLGFEEDYQRSTTNNVFMVKT